ncbi:MAG: class I SAM-dependent methyltransferase [Planctomycetota bacterium]
MSDIRSYYERYWSDPESYSDPTVDQRKSLLRKHVRLGPDAKILDAGCGTGEFCKFFCDAGYDPTGIDLSQAAVAHGRKNYPGIDFRDGTIEELLPQYAESFDALFSSEVIEHLFDVSAFLVAANQLLNDGGKLILTTPYHGLIKNILIDLAGYSNHYDPLGQHLRFFDCRGMKRCLDLAGFEVDIWSGYGRPWPLWKSFFVVAHKKYSVDKPPQTGSQGRVLTG